MPQDSPQWSVLIMHLKYEGPLPRHASQVDAANVLEHPAGCGVLSRLSFLAGEGGLGVRASCSDTLFPGRIDQPAHGHDPQEGHDPLGVLPRERGGQNTWVFENPQAAFHRWLAWIAFQPCQGWSRAVVQGVGRQEDTPRLRDERLRGSDRCGESPLALGDHLRRWHAWPRAAPPAVARRGADEAVGKRGGAPIGRQGRECVLGLGFTGQGRAAARLQGCGCCLALLGAMVVDRAPGLGTAGLGGDQPPAVRHAPSG